MKTLRWSSLSFAEQTELRKVVSTGTKATWDPEYDWVAFVLLGLAAAIVGTVVIGAKHGFGLSVDDFKHLLSVDFKAAFVIVTNRLLFLIPLGLSFSQVIFFVGNWKRRGYAVTSFAIVKVFGPNLKVMRHPKVTRFSCCVIRVRNGSYTSLELFDEQGKKCSFHTNSVFADAAIEAINRDRNEPLRNEG